jgi:hypothetical protein
MGLFLNFRTRSVGGAVIDPYVLEGDGTATPPALTTLDWKEIGRRASGKHVLLAAHGFNVSYESGASCLDRLGAALGLTSSELFLGILWPGDFWLPAVNYPFAGATSMDCGRRLARFCNRWLADAHAISFISHSLGARLVLEAVRNLDRPARVVCIAAGAINRDCLVTEYAAASGNAGAISTLASVDDTVLKLAFPVGDALSDVLDDDHTPFTPALGYRGPSRPTPAAVAPAQIPAAAGYNHGDYLPPSNPGPLAPGGKWRDAAGYMARAFRNQDQSWP